jgi:hypothetical protein
VLIEHYQTQTHLSSGKDAPEPGPIQGCDERRVVSLPEVGGLHYRYERRAA